MENRSSKLESLCLSDLIAKITKHHSMFNGERKGSLLYKFFFSFFFLLFYLLIISAITKSHASGKSKSAYFRILRKLSDVFFDADSKSPHDDVE